MVKPSGYLAWTWFAESAPDCPVSYIVTLTGERRLRVGKLLVVLTVRWS